MYIWVRNRSGDQVELGRGAGLGERDVGDPGGDVERLHLQLAEAATDPSRLLELDRELKAVVAEREAVEMDWLAAAELAES